MLRARGEIKSIRPLATKSDGGAGEGTGTAVVAIFGNVDSYGDRIVKGAFAADLAKSQTYPFYWNHGWDKVPVGVITAARETDEGLEVDFKLYLEEHPEAKALRQALIDGAIKDFSIGYVPREVRYVDETIDDLEVEIRELVDIELLEGGPVFRGANSLAHLVGMKGEDRGDDRDALLVKAVDLAAALAELDADAGEQLRAAAIALKTSAAPAATPKPAPSGKPTKDELDALQLVLAQIPLPSAA